MPDQAAPTCAVFCSYVSEDAEAAAGRICETLRAAGIETWSDRKNYAGEYRFNDAHSPGGSTSGQGAAHKCASLRQARN